MLETKNMEMMQNVVDFFDEFDHFFETAKRELKPVLDAIWEHYDNSEDRDDRAHGLMLGMAMKHDCGRHWTLSDVHNALQYAKLYMADSNNE